MLSLLKKTADKGDGPSSLGWHPNFRNYTQLPDTKVVRTSFFVNGITASLAFAVLLMFAYQEYTLHLVGKEIGEWEQKITELQGPSSQAVALFKKFKEEESKLADVESFLKAEKLVLTEFVARLGAVLPPQVAITLVDYTSTGVVLRGVVNGEPDQASGIASDFERLLREDSVLGKSFTTISLNTLSREAQGGRLTFEIGMRFQEAAKKK